MTITDPDGDDDASAFFSVSRVEICFLKFERINNVYDQMDLKSGYAFNRFSCFVLLVFSYPATSWPGPLVSCNVGDKDRLVVKYFWCMFKFFFLRTVLLTRL